MQEQGGTMIFENFNLQGQCFCALLFQFHKLQHLLDGHACVVQQVQQMDPAQVDARVAPVSIGRALNGWHQPDPFIIAQGINADACAHGGLLDRVRHWVHVRQYNTWSTLQVKRGMVVAPQEWLFGEPCYTYSAT